MGGQPETLSQPGRHGHGDRDRDWALAAGSGGPCAHEPLARPQFGELEGPGPAGGGLSATSDFGDLQLQLQLEVCCNSLAFSPISEICRARGQKSRRRANQPAMFG